MFGYVKPLQSELLVKDYEFYRATYCGVCRAMKKHTGFFSNVMLTYDSVFLALVRMLWIPDESISAKKKRCGLHPIKSRPMLLENEALEYTAKAFAILTYYKLLDDLHDEKLMKRMAKSALRPIFKGAKNRGKLVELSNLVAEKLAAITKLEDEKCKSVDEPASLFGDLLAEIFAFGFSGNDRLVLHECGYYLGRFIYAADAAEDYEKDIVSGSYNPYVLTYGKELSRENRENIKCALILECKRIEAAVNLMPFGNRITIENIIKNIIYLGLIKRIDFLDKAPETLSEKENKQ